MSASIILVGPDDEHQPESSVAGTSAGQTAALEDTRPLILVIAGPTASGKTRLALELANHRSLEIVNADSRAFYRGMDAGTAKPTLAERSLVPHHLIDVLDPDEPMSITIFQQLAMEAIGDIQERKQLPVIVGGSAQYLNALIEGWQAPAVPPNESFRQEREREAEQFGVETLLNRLMEIDPVAAERTGPNLRRIIRALEVWDATGVRFSEAQSRGEVPFQALEVELWLPREVLHARIDARVDEMIANGLAEEVQGLLTAGYDATLPAFSSIGYRQLVPAIVDGEDMAEAIARIKIDTNKLVRHQQTWFRRNPRLQRIDMTQPDPIARLLEMLSAAGG